MTENEMNRVFFLLVFLSLVIIQPAYAEDDDNGHEESTMVRSIAEHDKEKDHLDENRSAHDHKEGEHDHHEEASDVELDEAQRRTAGIETITVNRQLLGNAITAPGEVMLNAYRTVKVTPRINAQVIKRHVRLGDHVKKDQPLVTLSSVEMSEAQGELLEADTEWKRVQKLGRKVVSEKRYIAAQVAYQQSVARVHAYGMTASQTDALQVEGDASRATGEFTLLAAQEGTIITDDFIVGELIEPGHVLFTLSDESLLWVETRLTPEDAGDVAVGAPARVKAGNNWLDGEVIQSRHTLDETTRTLAVHVEVANPEDRLHPGQFVTVTIEGKEKQSGIAVPLPAVLRSPDGDWQVYVETAQGRFEPREIKVLGTMGDRMLIDGIDEGASIVGNGAFFIQSEIAKGGFEVHNH